MKKEIIILQFSRRLDVCAFIKEAMNKIHPELLEQTKFYTNLKDAKEKIITPQNLLSREGKEMIIVTGAVLLDENGDRIIKKINNWNPLAQIIVFSSSLQSISKKNKIEKMILKKIEKHNSPECYEDLIREISQIL